MLQPGAVVAAHSAEPAKQKQKQTLPRAPRAGTTVHSSSSSTTVPASTPETLELGPQLEQLKSSPGHESDDTQLSAALEALEQEQAQREFPAEVDGPLLSHEWLLRPDLEPEPEPEPEPAEVRSS